MCDGLCDEAKRGIGRLLLDEFRETEQEIGPLLLVELPIHKRHDARVLLSETPHEPRSQSVHRSPRPPFSFEDDEEKQQGRGEAARTKRRRKGLEQNIKHHSSIPLSVTTTQAMDPYYSQNYQGGAGGGAPPGFNPYATMGQPGSQQGFPPGPYGIPDPSMFVSSDPNAFLQTDPNAYTSAMPGAQYGVQYDQRAPQYPSNPTYSSGETPFGSGSAPYGSGGSPYNSGNATSPYGSGDMSYQSTPVPLYGVPAYASSAGPVPGAVPVQTYPPSTTASGTSLPVPSSSSTSSSSHHHIHHDLGTAKATGGSTISSLFGKVSDATSILTGMAKTRIKHATRVVEKDLFAPKFSWDELGNDEMKSNLRSFCPTFGEKLLSMLFYRFRNACIDNLKEFHQDNLKMSRYYRLDDSAQYPQFKTYRVPCITLDRFKSFLPGDLVFPTHQMTLAVGGDPLIASNLAIRGAYRSMSLAGTAVFHSQWTDPVVTLNSWCHALHIFCKGTSEQKVQAITELFCEEANPQYVMYHSFWSKAKALASLGLATPSGGASKPKASVSDVDEISAFLFPQQTPQLTREQFIYNISYLGSRPDLYGVLLDGFGLLPYWYFSIINPFEELFSGASCRIEDFHYEGFLTKNARIAMPKWTQHWCILHNGFFFYFPINNLYDEIQSCFWFGDTSVTIKTMESKGNAFQIVVAPTADAPILQRFFCAPDAESYQLWKNAIMAARPPANRPNHSFAPVRYPVNGKWFIDGRDTYLAMLQEIQRAREQIFLSDWFLSPQVNLLREEGHPTIPYRLENLLRAKAMDGVKVCVLIWKETSLAVDLGSANVKQVLEGLHRNIRVIHHPFLNNMIFSHHQKILVCDQNVAFIGGLDLCFGRWDTQNHSVIDPERKIFYGQDYYNPSFAEFSEVANSNKESVDASLNPRMPWHDIHTMIDGPVARDVAANFIQRWNHHLLDLSVDTEFLIPKASVPYYITSRTVHEPSPTPMFPVALPLPPTHSFGLDVAYGMMPNAMASMSFSSSSSSSSGPGSGLSQCGHADIESNLEVQVLRSICDWSGGCQTEQSIYHAYIETIKNAEKFIYIENQYFISSCSRFGQQVINSIADEIYKRIYKAIVEHQVFRVCVIVPFGPEGDFENGPPRVVMAYQRTTLFSGLVERIRTSFPAVNTKDYISIHCVKNWGELPRSLVAEQIYIHSKLMIVDDRIVICGSANINDRSMEGNRDSEIAVIIRQPVRNGAETLSIPFNGQPFLVSRFAHRLRASLWLEHLGLRTEDYRLVQDPISNATWHDLWIYTSNFNDTIFDNVFEKPPGKVNFVKQSSKMNLAKISQMKSVPFSFSFSFSRLITHKQLDVLDSLHHKGSSHGLRNPRRHERKCRAARDQDDPTRNLCLKDRQTDASFTFTFNSFPFSYLSLSPASRP